MIYGKNGSGKSALGEALSVLNKDQEHASEAMSESASGLCDLEVTPLFSEGGTSPDFNNADSLVFNESFIEHHVKLKRDGLETVVLLGEQVQVQEELENARDAHKAHMSIVEKSESELSAAREHQEAVFLALQKELRIGWAQRQKIIRGNSGSSPVGKGIVAKILGVEVPANFSTNAAQELSVRIADFLSMSEYEASTRPWLNLLPGDYLMGVRPELLTETLDAPTGSGIAQRVGQTLQSFAPEVHRAREVFSDESNSYCPLCLQDTPTGYKAELLEAISAAIDDTAKEFSDRLHRSKVQLIELDSSLIDARFTQEIERFEAARIGLNSQLQEWNAACEAKKLTMYSPVDWDSENLQVSAAEFQASLTALEERANEIDQAIKERSKHQRKLEEDNVIVARLECDAFLSSFKQAAERHSKATLTLESERQKLEELARLEAGLAARLMNAHVAVDEINASLRSIFAENGRLELSLSAVPGVDPHYVLRTRGRAVQPNRLSIGERNIVALSYFFVSVRKQLDELAKSGSSRWLIIGVDDPVSSVDMDNRLGIHGFLGAQMQRIFAHSYANVKMVLLTHDLGVARELEKASTSALLAAVKKRNEDWNWNFNQVGNQLISKFELSAAHKLVRVDGPLSKQNDYGRLLNGMWIFATEMMSADDILTLTIGNVTRRVLEAFSTFIYNESSIPSHALSEEYARIRPGAELIVDLGSGHRMFLHEGSHSEGKLTAMTDFGGIAVVDTDEQIRHVRKVLAFMFTLQPYHVTTFLKAESKGAAATLEEWCQTLLGQ